MTAVETRVGPDEWHPVLTRPNGYQLVVAGPGTGKTEFLIRRAASIVESGHARRHQIAILTFSRRAAADIAGRLDPALGSTGTPADTTTFHSLALRLLEAGPSGNRPVPLTTPEQVGVVRNLLSREDPSDWPLTYRGIIDSPAFAAEVADFLMRCSERLLDPEELAGLAEERADWRGLPSFYQRYLQRLDETGRTDYGVLLTSAVRLLGTEEGQALASHYRYVLVDEYQDTSSAQAEMARLLSKPHGNLTVSGDPYQSIYSFRGAELGNVADFEADHPDVWRIVLTESLRVPADIMDAALAVVSGGSLPGAAGLVEPARHNGSVATYLFDQETAEAEWIAAEVERSIRIEDIDPSKIAVLVRTKRELLNELSRALDRRGIPHDPPQARLVDHPAVRLIHDLVVLASTCAGASTAAELADADRAMRRTLLGPVIGLTLGRERDIVRKRRRTALPWPEILRVEIPEAGDVAYLIEDGDWAFTKGAADGFWHAWSHLGAIGSLVNDPGRSDWRRAWTAFAQALGRQSDRDPSVTLADYFEMTEDSGFEATPLLSHHPESSRVTLTTLHQAKGLEFDVVFIANAVEGVFPDLRRSRRMLRPELLSPERRADPSALHMFQLQEEMRLAYTAMTRARLKVVWTATEAGVDQGERRPSRFLLAAAGVLGASEIGAPQAEGDDVFTLRGAETALRRTLADPSASAVDRIAAAAILNSPIEGAWDPMMFPGVPEAGPDAPLLGEAVTLSPSQADRYETCPRLYALERRLRLGDAVSPHAHLGSLIHSALETAEREIVGSGLQHAELGRVLDVLREVWDREAAFGSPQLSEAWYAKAEEAVTKLYENWPHPDGKPIGVEETVTQDVAGVRWVGVVDRVEQLDEGLRVVDYKTGTRPPTEAEAAQSVQLGFYASALSGRGPVAEAEMWFPRAGAKSVTTRALDIDSLDGMNQHIEAVTRSILAEDWAPTPGAHCQRCAFSHSCPAWPEGRGAYLP